MTEIMILALVPLFAVVNRVRGSFGAGGVVGGAVLGGVVLALSLNPVLAGVCALLYVAGESVGWGRWIKLIGRSHDGVSQFDYMDHHREPNRGKFIHKLANKIVKESKDYVSYAWMALWIRAAMWFPPIFLALAVAGVVDPIIAVLCSAFAVAMFPVSYSVGRQISKTGWWGRGEIIYGACQGVALALAFIA